MSDQTKKYERFNIARRLEHILLILSFSLLAVTGLVQKYALNTVSISIISFLGGIEMVRIIHRIAAVIFFLEGVYHFILMAYLVYVKRKEASMMPGIKDIIDAVQSFLHNFGLRKEAPKMPRYNYTEKMEYLAMIWGYILMGLTGFMLWNPILTTRIFPGEIIPAAKVAHGLEAVLAVLAIILWHFYHVHIKQWNWSMFKGYLTHHEMKEEHALELEKIELDEPEPEVDPVVYKKRMKVFTPVSIIFTAIMVAFVIFLANYEETAITTVPRVYADVDVFVPRTPTPFPTSEPTPTPDPMVANSWDGGIGFLFEQKCGLCHGESGGLDFKTYSGILQGGNSGMAVIPGRPDESLIMQIQAPGNEHPGQFSDEELERVRIWILNGARK
ncbi:MAG TPA: cytochrome b/b6 domain-containing protein [Anaerolineaceae bacterium]|nr:cytochrome b/b6 domain-containing protein [Anaerolineaceae bacterium]